MEAHDEEPPELEEDKRDEKYDSDCPDPNQEEEEDEDDKEAQDNLMKEMIGHVGHG